jgi:hypothetical protein
MYKYNIEVDNINQKSLFLTLVYMIIFLFSVFAIIQIKYITSTEPLRDDTGSFNILFITSPPIKLAEFIAFKLTLFAVTAVVSFLMMVSTLFMHRNPSFEERVLEKASENIKQAKQLKP